MFIINLSLHLLWLIYNSLIYSVFSSRGCYWIADHFSLFCSCQIYTSDIFKTRGHTLCLGLVSGSTFFICFDLCLFLALICDWLEVTVTEEWLGGGSGTGTKRDDCKMQRSQFVVGKFTECHMLVCYYMLPIQSAVRLLGVKVPSVQLGLFWVSLSCFRMGPKHLHQKFAICSLF